MSTSISGQVLHCLRYFQTDHYEKGMYTPLSTPNRAWESISMDYMSGVPSTKRGNDFVFVVVDHFSKMAIMVSCKKSITTEALPSSSLNEWVHF
jgi:hypothetical protein